MISEAEQHMEGMGFDEHETLLQTDFHLEPKVRTFFGISEIPAHLLQSPLCSTAR